MTFKTIHTTYGLTAIAVKPEPPLLVLLLPVTCVCDGTNAAGIWKQVSNTSLNY